MIGRRFKRCSQCQQSKPLTAFYRNAGARDVRAGKCKECKKVYNAAYYRDKNGPKKEPTSPKPRWKMCIRCKRKRQPEQFLLHFRNPDGRTRLCFADIMKPARSTGKSTRGKKSLSSSSGSFGYRKCPEMSQLGTFPNVSCLAPVVRVWERSPLLCSCGGFIGL